MMYKQKLAVAIKANGRILREFGDTVKLPYGQEYSVLIKNLNSVRVQVRISIDGTSTSEDTWLVIQPNSELDLKRFIKNGNFDKGNAFKFIEKTEAIENHRGSKIDDGLIRVEFQFEKPYVPNTLVWNYNHDWNRYGSPTTYDGYTATYTVANSAHNATLSNSVASAAAAKGVLRGANAVSQSVETANDAGITVPGSEVNQKFSQASWFQTESETHVLVMKLSGFVNSEKIEQAITVKHKPKCTSCGKQNKATAKFCTDCGTSLNLL
jgi:hypothetical protein